VSSAPAKELDGLHRSDQEEHRGDRPAGRPALAEDDHDRFLGNERQANVAGQDDDAQRS